MTAETAIGRGDDVVAAENCPAKRDDPAGDEFGVPGSGWSSGHYAGA